MEKFKKPLVEDLSTPNDPNIATTDENLTVDQMFQQTILPSVGRQIFSILPINGPTGALFNLRKKAASNDFELVRRDVEVYPSESIKTGVTKEAIQDIIAQYGRNAYDIIGTMLRGLANEQENTRTLAFLEANAKAGDFLQLSGPNNAELNLFEITQRVHEYVLAMNNQTLRTYEAFAVVPAKPLAGVMALHAYAGGEHKEERGLYIAHIGQTKFYLNPDANSTTAYVGLKDSINPSKSSGVFSPYQSQVVEATDPDTGENTFFIFNRFAISASPLHVTDNEMFYKFEVLV